jgi:hypothetical protein
MPQISSTKKMENSKKSSLLSNAMKIEEKLTRNKYYTTLTEISLTSFQKGKKISQRIIIRPWKKKE